jgi:hypothetical protein
MESEVVVHELVALFENFLAMHCNNTGGPKVGKRLLQKKNRKKGREAKKEPEKRKKRGESKEK